jgi:hypothetical protein
MKLANGKKVGNGEITVTDVLMYEAGIAEGMRRGFAAGVKAERKRGQQREKIIREALIAEILSEGLS